MAGEIKKSRRNLLYITDDIDNELYGVYSENSVCQLKDYPFLKKLLKSTNKKLNTSFNTLLLNQYIDGSKTIGAHSDNEEVILGESMIGTLAFGATRKFRIRDKRSKEIVYDIEHISGSLIVMDGKFQSYYTHEIPKQLKIKESRISVTFRNHDY